MTIKTREIYSPNFNLRRRKNNQIKFLIFHYTGMKNEKIAIKHLSKIQSEVSTNYFIKRNGEILIMVPDFHTALHAGISKWGEKKFLNKYSIGIEISNPGHRFGYVNFSPKQIESTVKLAKKLILKPKEPQKNILYSRKMSPC